MQNVKGEVKKGKAKYIHVNVTVANPLNPSLKDKVRFIADTGAVGCVITEDTAKRLKLQSRGSLVAVMADGSEKTVATSFALLKFDDKEVYAWIAYGKGFEPLLGLDVMEILGIHVDVPSKNLLIPLKRFRIKNFTVTFGWKKTWGGGGRSCLVRFNRNTMLIRKLNQTRRIFQLDTQNIRVKLISRLEELFNLAQANAKSQRLDIGQREKWAKIAAFIAQTINSLTQAFDERAFDDNLKKLESLIEQAKAKAAGTGEAAKSTTASAAS